MATARRKVRAKAAPRRKTAKSPAASRAKTKVKARSKAKARPKQTFTVSHHREEDFETGGLRTYAKYRDLGMSRSTNGLVQAHVIRFLPPFRPEEVSKLHFHDVEFQMIYVLKGWIETELEGQGPIVMEAGSCWLQPPRIKHAVLDYSDDCEVLEIVMPADFETVTLE